jgi:hypothetical protein
MRSHLPSWPVSLTECLVVEQTAVHAGRQSKVGGLSVRQNLSDVIEDAELINDQAMGLVLAIRAVCAADGL